MGHGRRTGWLSNLHLGARGPDGGFVMVGKTFKGLTDDLLRWQTQRLQDLAIGTEGHVVHVARPSSSRSRRRCPGVDVIRVGSPCALRGTPVPRTRAAEADRIEDVQALLN